MDENQRLAEALAEAKAKNLKIDGAHGQFVIRDATTSRLVTPEGRHLDLDEVFAYLRATNDQRRRQDYVRDPESGDIPLNSD